MERWHDRIAVVTGASCGIGAACALELVRAGMRVVALARREQRLQQLNEQLPLELREKLFTRKCDVTNEKEVIDTFKWLADTFNDCAHVLINNAGIVRTTELVQKDNTTDIRATWETNVMGVLYCTREAFNLMRSYNCHDGHVVIINSTCGHQTLNLGLDWPSFNIYPATKHAVTSMVETYRQEFLRHQTKIRITSISPGAVDTEIFPDEVAHIVKAQMPMLKSEDVANAVLYAIAAPEHVQVHELILKPVGELY